METHPLDLPQKELPNIVQVIERKKIMKDVQSLSEVSGLRAALIILHQWIWIILAWSCTLLVVFVLTGTINISQAVFKLNIAEAAVVGLIYLSSIAIIASRQHALGILMHDGTHYRLFKNRVVNDVICDFFCSFPIGLSTNLYRREHLLHHQFVNTEKDPYVQAMSQERDWDWPKTQFDCLKVMISDLLAINTAQWLKALSHWMTSSNFFKVEEAKPLVSQRERICFLSFVTCLIGCLWITGGWLQFLIFWIVPGYTILTMFTRMRSIAEHLMLENEHELNRTRHVDGRWFERATIAPLCINYHIAHHMFASVPFYNLPKLHERLMEEEEFRMKAKLVPTYLGLKDGVLGEMLRSHRLTVSQSSSS